MDLDNIQLTPFLLQELYKTSMIEYPKTFTIAEKIQHAPVWNVLGNNLKGVIIMVYGENSLHLPDEQLNFLMGILAACKLSMEDVAIINLATNKPVTYKALELDLKAEKIILFGVSPAQITLPLEFPHYQIQRYNNQTYLVSAALNIVQADKAEKTKLWNCLKQIFIS